MEYSSKTTAPLAGHGCLLPGWMSIPLTFFFIMNWWPRSLYLNPIEHLWNVLERGLKAYSATTATLTEVWTLIVNAITVMGLKVFPWNTSANLLNLSLTMWQPEEVQFIINLLFLIQWHYSVLSNNTADPIHSHGSRKSFEIKRVTRRIGGGEGFEQQSMNLDIC